MGKEVAPGRGHRRRLRPFECERRIGGSRTTHDPIDPHIRWKIGRNFLASTNTEFTADINPAIGHIRFWKGIL
ncbi:hypothetical protein GHA01_16630 [Novacetimonas hansenii]|uniref:Transposase n=1 Tax=Novacetimonas hansenii TaxID=436 RepID=A0ABQ0SF55_NOVHA|nr:hypothetical protein Gaha_0057_003 [Novacetimonas hansenii JCM 7643]GBQ54058.1 hypothetical protein AA0243_0523 [Novacetimonas hansenii NRIC 0243]GEC63814.1 hypothetical protein GHA01_16630 [Novacetimonas hansenii]